MIVKNLKNITTLNIIWLNKLIIDKFCIDLKHDDEVLITEASLRF
jgi:hypothetical protein